MPCDFSLLVACEAFKRALGCYILHGISFVQVGILEALKRRDF